MVINIKSFFRMIILIGLILAPINGIFESIELVFGTIENTRSAVAPIYVKSVKDIVLGICLLLGIVGFLTNTWRLSIFLSFLCFLALLIGTMLKSGGNDSVYFLTGYRWVLPFILIFLSIRFVDKQLLISCSKILILIFLLHFTLQVLQFLFLKSFFYGVNAFGFSLRNPGFFLIPSTAGFFSVLCLYFILYFSNISTRSKWLFVIIGFLSAFLTASGTALVAWFTIFSIWCLSSKNLMISIFPVVFLLVFFFVSLGVITGRGPEYIELSLGIRLDVFKDLLLNSSLISEYFGFGTSTAYMMGIDAIVTDSTFAGLLVNFGLIGFLYVIFIIALIGIESWLCGSKPVLTFVAVLTMYLATTSVPEAYPMNLLSVLLISYFIKYGMYETRQSQVWKQSEIVN